MKVSVSLPDEDVEFLDQYAQTQGYESLVGRSPHITRPFRLLHAPRNWALTTPKRGVSGPSQAMPSPGMPSSGMG